MRRHAHLFVTAMSLGFAAACGGGGGAGGSSPTGPTVTISQPPSDPKTTGTVTSSNGCASTFMCPNVDASGNANPSTPTIERLTLENGTSSSCRADLTRNPPTATVPIEFTIRNPEIGGASSHIWSTNDGDVGGTPNSGPANSAGPFRVMGQFGNLQGKDISSGKTVSATLTVSIKRTGSPLVTVAACSVAVWGYVVPGK
jgi:hypothetical protein